MPLLSPRPPLLPIPLLPIPLLPPRPPLLPVPPVFPVEDKRMKPPKDSRRGINKPTSHPNCANEDRIKKCTTCKTPR